MKISEMITDRYKLRIPPTVYYDLLADVQEAEDEQKPILDKIRTEIENHCGLTKENHCKYCSYCNSVMGVREILEIMDKYKTETEVKE